MFSLQPYLWHPIFVHFTVALLTSGALFHAVAWSVRSGWRGRLAAAGELTLWLGVALTVVTVATGWLAFETVPHADDAVHELMEQHRTLGVATLGIFVALALIGAWHRRHAAYPSGAFVAALLLGLVAVGWTGLRGGELVYEHGVAVERPRAADVASKAQEPDQAKGKPTVDHSSHNHQHAHK